MTAMVMGTAVNAQNGTNLKFEDWSGSPEMPTGWTPFSAQDSISKTTGIAAIEGNSSMLVANTMFQDVSSSDSLGGSFIAQFVGLVSDSVSLLAAPVMLGTDTAQVALTLFDGSTNLGSYVLEFHAGNSTPGSVYTYTFNLTAAPTFTGFNLSFYSSKTPNNAGSFLVVDDIKIHGNYAGVETQELDVISAFPNPVANSLTINLGNNSADLINIIDMTGRIVETITVSNTTESVDMSIYNNGVYFYQVVSNGIAIKTEKIIVAK